MFSTDIVQSEEMKMVYRIKKEMQLLSRQAEKDITLPSWRVLLPLDIFQRALKRLNSMDSMIY